MNKIYKTLIYFFYCRNDIYEYKEVFDLHLELLKQNINIFNYSKFILAFNDLNNNELIDFYKNYIKDYLCINDNFEFIVVQNDPINREGIYFYNEVILKLNEYDGLLFFGHNKSDLHNAKKNTYDWITGSHFINFYDINDIENKLIYDKYIAYGSFPICMINQSQYILNIYHYSGTFFWINPKKIYNLHNKEINIYVNFFIRLLYEQNNDFIKNYKEFRFVAEQFLHNICNFYTECTTLNNLDISNGLMFYTYEMKNIINGNTLLISNIEKCAYYYPITKYYLTEEQNIEFNEYFDNICNKLNIKFN